MVRECGVGRWSFNLEVVIGCVLGMGGMGEEMGGSLADGKRLEKYVLTIRDLAGEELEGEDWVGRLCSVSWDGSS